MQGLIHNADVYNRVTIGTRTTFELSASGTWPCNIQPIDPRMQVSGPYSTCTHVAYGPDTPVIKQGSKLIEPTLGEFAVAGVSTWGVPNRKHQQVYLRQATI